MMTLEEAGTLVLADARRHRDDASDPASDADVLALVHQNVSLDDVVDYRDETTEAYRVFLAHHQNPTRSQLCVLVMALSDGTLDQLNAEYRVWHQRIMRGDVY